MSDKKQGIAHLIVAIRYAFDGLKVLSCETAFRHEIIFLFAILGIFSVFNVDYYHYVTAFILWCFLIATEAINTAIELIVDKISPEISDFAKKTKDIASFAVFCMVTANCLFVLFAITSTHINFLRVFKRSIF